MLADNQIIGMPREVIDNPQRWRDRAEELRALAENKKEPVARAIMLSMAADYDRLAEQAEARRVKH